MLKKVLVINLTRFGDLIQSQPVFTYFKQRGYKVGLWCLENFSAVSKLLSDIEVIYPFSGGDILANLAQKKWVNSLNLLFQEVEKIKKEFSPEIIVNLTPSLSAKILTLLFRPIPVLGFGLDRFGFSSYNNNWAAFLEASSKFREASPLNLVDLYLGIVAYKKQNILKPSLKPVAKEQKVKWHQRLLKRGKKFIAFQLGASKDERRWPISYFAKLGKICLDKLGLVPVLLGSASEISLAEKFKQLVSYSYVNLIGKTSLEDLQAVLTNCSFLVTNDTGTMHFAIANNIKVVAIFLATAQSWDTGPYLEDCICLEPWLDCHPCNFNYSCFHKKCRYAISPDIVLKAIEILENANYKPRLFNSRIYRTLFKNNMFFLENINKKEDKRYEFMKVNHIFYYNFLNDNLDVKSFIFSNFQENIYKEIKVIRDYFFVFREQLKSLEVSPLSGRKNKLVLFHSKLLANLEKTKYFSPLAHLWFTQTQQNFSTLQDFYHLADKYYNFFNKLSGE